MLQIIDLDTGDVLLRGIATNKEAILQKRALESAMPGSALAVRQQPVERDDTAEWARFSRAMGVAK